MPAKPALHLLSWGARFLTHSDLQIAIQIGDTVLVHGGLRKKHIDYGLERLNGVTKRWLEEGVGLGKPAIVDEVS